MKGRRQNFLSRVLYYYCVEHGIGPGYFLKLLYEVEDQNPSDFKKEFAAHYHVKGICEKYYIHPNEIIKMYSQRLKKNVA